MRSFLDRLYDGAAALAALLQERDRLTGRLKGAALRRLELWALGLACLLSLLLAFYSVRLCWQSRLFNDISTSNDATPLWIPQLSMAIGAVILFVAFVDEWVLEFRGLRRPVVSDQPLHNE